MSNTTIFKQKLVSVLVMSTFLATTFGAPSAAYAADGVIDCSCCEAGTAGQACRDSCGMMQQAQAQNRAAMIERVKPTPASQAFSQGSCIDTLMNTRINLNFSVMAADAIIQAIINMVKNAACAAVMGAWQQALGKVNAQLGTAVNIPGIGNVIDIGAGVGASSGAGAGIINMQGNGVQGVQSYSASGVQNAVQGGVQSVQSFGSANANAVTTNANAVKDSGSSVISKVKGLFN